MEIETGAIFKGSTIFVVLGIAVACGLNWVLGNQLGEGRQKVDHKKYFSNHLEVILLTQPADICVVAGASGIDHQSQENSQISNELEDRHSYSPLIIFG